MGFFSDKFAKIKKTFRNISPYISLGMLMASCCAVVFGVYYGSAGAVFGGLVAICGGALSVIPSIVMGKIDGLLSDPGLSDYDLEIIGNGFTSGKKRSMLRIAVGLLHEGNADDALSILREIKEEQLTEREEGVCSFYIAVCCNRQGYPTNAGHAAADAAEKGVMLPDSLLMAARSFFSADSIAMAEEYYERLLPIAEEEHIFPFIYNEMGRMYLMRNKPDKSGFYFNKAVENGLDPITAQGGLALVDLLEGREEEACERYRLALIANISDADNYRDYCAQVCVANGYPENFFEVTLKEKYSRKPLYEDKELDALS